MDISKLQDLSLENDCFDIFDYISDIIFFLKSKDGVFMKVNNTFLKTFGYSSKNDVIGKTDRELFSKDLADMYKHSDKQLLCGELEIYQKEELIYSQNDCVNKYLTTKFPIRDNDGEINAIVGITRNILNLRESCQSAPALQRALDYIDENYMEDIKITTLSDMSHMSDSTFLRTFKKDFNLTPKRYIISRRLKKVAEYLNQTDKPFCEISILCGFSDQSHMTREFRKVTGITPSSYLRRVKAELEVAQLS
ncbi:MAG: AraC family transcriptional regulator [Lentisphaeraceae bacterium]|nr:AraC family transcriptional regulator [Lentisphaeraceae bacterium]